MQRKAYIEIVSYDSIEITTPFRQKRFQLDDGVIAIDLINLKKMNYSIPPDSKFFLVIEKKEFETLGGIFGYDTSSLLAPIGAIGLGIKDVNVPKNISVKTVVIDD